MKPEAMDRLVEEHIAAESAGDTALLGEPGNGKRVLFRMLHLWQFRGALISRENG